MENLVFVIIAIIAFVLNGLEKKNKRARQQRKSNAPIPQMVGFPEKEKRVPTIQTSHPYSREGERHREETPQERYIPRERDKSAPKDIPNQRYQSKSTEEELEVIETGEDRQDNNFIQDLIKDEKSLVKGMVYAEILGQPRSMKKLNFPPNRR